MPLVQDQTGLYRFAVKNQRIIPAFNFYDVVSMRAILNAAEETDSPVILQISQNVHKQMEPLEAFLAYVLQACGECSAPVMVHHDYLQTAESCMQMVDLGVQSVSFDGQRLSFQENMRITKEIVEYAHERGVLVEAEVGAVPGDGFVSESIYTDPMQAARFCKETGCDALAVSVGTSHGGLRKKEPLHIRYDLLDEIREAVGDVPLVLHGAASRLREYTDRVNRYGGAAEYLMMATEEEVSECRHHGVAKIYADMDNWLAVTGALREYYSKNPETIQPAVYLPVCGEAMRISVIRKIERVTKSVGLGSRYWETKSLQ